MSTTLVLVRHGQTLHNVAGKLAGWTDSPLSEVGRRQAELVAVEVAARFSISALYSSPLERARFTAQAIGKQAGHTPVYLDDLKELNFGDLENMTEAEVSSSHPGIWAASQVLEDHTFSWPNGEARHYFYQRVAGAFAKIAAAHAGQTVAVVSHGGVIGAYLADILEGKPHLWHDYLVKNCSISVVEIGADGARSVLYQNDHSYLPDTRGDRMLAALATGEGSAEG